MDEYKLIDLLTYTRDGEWGKGEPTKGYVLMSVIRGTDFEKVRFGDLSTVPTRYIREDIANRKMLEPGDILIETAGGTKDQPTGRTVYLSDSVFLNARTPITCASFSRFLRVKRNVVDPKFLFWALQDKYNSNDLLPFHIQHTGVARFQFTDFSKSFPFSLPDYKKQIKIAGILSALDDKIDLNRRMNETLEAMARAIFKDWFVDFGPTRAKMEGRTPYLAQEIWDLFPDALDDEGKPAGWISCRIGEFAKIGRGASPRPINDYMGGDVPWVKISDATASTSPFIYKTKEFVTKKGSEKSVSRRSGSLILSNSATCGLPYFLGIDACIHDGWLYFDIEDDIKKYTLYFTLAHISEKLIGLADGSVQKNLNIDLVGSQSMIVPGALILDNFALCAKTFFNRIKSNDIESRTLAQTRDLLLPKLMSGEIRVKDAEKAVEQAL